MRYLTGWLAMLSNRMLLLAALALGSPALAQNSDLAQQVERLTAAGRTASARALVDSALRATPEGGPTFAEALYWHAVLDTTAAGAERAYLRVALEYPLSDRASGALLRLAELELARGARERARRHLERLRREYPHSAEAARAQYLAARLAFDAGQTASACALLAGALASASAQDVELRNQIVFLQGSCVAAAPADSVARESAVRPPVGPEFSIQVAAYNTQREATALARQLQRRGVTARVVGSSAPFRVRIGRYPDRESAQRAMRQAEVRGIVVEAEPR